MPGHGFSILLGPLWEQWEGHLFRLVEGLHRGLPPTIPVVTLHGRQLDPVDEGVGAQYQLTMNGRLYDGRYRAAYLVIQVQLFRQQPPPAVRGAGAQATIAWRVDALPVLEQLPAPGASQGPIERFDQRTAEMPVAEPERLSDLFTDPAALPGVAADFFQTVLAGTRLS